MNSYFINAGICFISIGIVLSTVLLVKKIKSSKKVEQIPQRHLFDGQVASNSSQFKVLVSASKTSGSFDRSELAKEKGFTHLSELNTLKEIKNKLSKDMEYLDGIIKTDNSFLLPVASGKASKLQFIGSKFYTIISFRYDDALLLSKSDRPSSADVKELIHKPYVIKFDVLNDLVGGESGNRYSWGELVAWAETFSEEVSEVRKSIDKKPKVG